MNTGFKGIIHGDLISFAKSKEVVKKVLLIVLLLTHFDLALAVNAIQHPNDENIKYPQKDEDGELLPALELPGSSIFWDVVAVQDVLRFCAAPGSIECEEKTGQWLERYFVGADAGDFVLLKTLDSDDKVLEEHGWVHKENLLVSPRALKNPNNIFKKILVINHWPEVKEGTIEDLNLAQVFNGLHKERKVERELKLFEIHFIYQEKNGFLRKKILFNRSRSYNRQF